MSQHATTRPVPVPDEISAPFFEGANRGKLMLQHCAACGRWSFPVRERCPHCLSAQLGWRAAGSSGLPPTVAAVTRSPGGRLGS